MLYQVTISRAGCIEDVVTVEAGGPLEAIDKIDAAFEKFSVMVSIGYGEIISVMWSGYEFEARQINGR